MNVHVYAELPDSTLDNLRKKTKDTAVAEAVRGDALYGVSAPDHLTEMFYDLIARKLQCNAMYFHTHGNPGVMIIGGERFTLDNMWRLTPFVGPAKFHEVFLPGAKIVFDGCAIAQGLVGERFLAAFGRTLLRNRGGSVWGNTGRGFANPFGGTVYHPFGDWVVAHVAVNGHVWMENAVYLDYGNLRQAIDCLGGRLRDSPYRFIPLRPKDIDGLQVELSEAERYLVHGRYTDVEDLYQAYLCVEAGRESYAKVLGRLPPGQRLPLVASP